MRWIKRLMCRVFGHRDRELEPKMRWVCERCGDVTITAEWVTREAAQRYITQYMMRSR